MKAQRPARLLLASFINLYELVMVPEFVMDLA